MQHKNTYYFVLRLGYQKIAKLFCSALLKLLRAISICNWNYLPLKLLPKSETITNFTYIIEMLMLYGNRETFPTVFENHSVKLSFEEELIKLNTTWHDLYLIKLLYFLSALQEA